VNADSVSSGSDLILIRAVSFWRGGVLQARVLPSAGDAAEASGAL
jgi:hypothetical protein